MTKSYTPETTKSNATITAPLYCGLIKAPGNAEHVSSRHILSVAGLYYEDKKGFEVLHIFGEADFIKVCEKQSKEKKERLGDEFDGNFLYDSAQQGFYRFYTKPDCEGVPAVLYCWMDTVDVPGSPSRMEYTHQLVVADENGKFDLRRPHMCWDLPHDIPFGIVNAKKDMQQFILNKFYPDYEEGIWMIKEWNHEAKKRMEQKELAKQKPISETMFGVAAVKKAAPIKKAVTRLDNRTKQIINTLLRRELGVEVIHDKEEGVLKLRDCSENRAKSTKDEGGINSIGQAFAAIA